ncbi:unannotated protein [freshwater metagenome]|uniref:Unannotated protein n=1 Tax=freshwater metagenome TaxID=449393 RepID=A0A6J5YJ06_9ZZZZ
MSGDARPPFDVGIVVAARNAATTIGRALQSVLDAVVSLSLVHSYEVGNIDVVVVDGSSVDETRDVAATFPGVRVIAQTGEGLGQARNQGTAEVTGELIAFLDADDRWAAGALDLRLRFLVDQPAALGVVGHMMTEALPGQSVDARHRQKIGVPVVGYTPGALVARRRAFDLIGPFDETLVIATDSEWFIRARSGGHSIAILDEVVLFKGARAASLSADVSNYRRELLDVSRRFLSTREKPS